MKEDEILVKVEHVSKKFCKDLKTSLWYGVKDLVSKKASDDTVNTLRPKEFWAVKDVSFELRRGTCLGLVGHNGAGKSTLLKILNGLINPDTGKVTIKGRVGALIELGAGFNPILTGRENIYNNGAILGFTRKEIDTKLQEIIDFSELEEFIDMPVQNYSSGMKVRLGFAVAAQMEPDVLIIDEVLAVGDIGFRVKCLNRISELLKSCAIIFVSHSMPQIVRLATNGILMQYGEVILETKDTGKLIQQYYSFFESEKQSKIGSGKAELIDFELANFMDKENDICVYQDTDILVRAKTKIASSIKYFAAHVIIVDIETKQIAMISSLTSNQIVRNRGKILNISVSIPILFSDGTYSMYFTLVEILSGNRIGDTLVSHRGIGKFIVNKKTYPSPIGIQIPCIWHFED